MKEIIITALTSALLSAYITASMQRSFDKKKEQEALYFEIYMKLMELHGYLFWLASAQIRKEEEPEDINQKVFSLKWQIADIARKLEAGELEVILETLFLERLSHRGRYEKLSKVINNMGYKANSRYKNIMQRIDKENLRNNDEQLEKLSKQ